MKTLLTTLAFVLTFSLTAQSDAAATVERSITSLQFNLGAVHVVHERGVSDDLTLRLEVGTQQQFRYASPESSTNNSYYALRPVVGLGGRYYYNLDKRAERGQRITNNSGNFIGLLAQYRPDFFLYNSNPNVNAFNYVNANAHWGIRRQLGRRFDFEFTAGINLRAGGRLLGQRSIIGGSQPFVDWRFGYRF